MPYQKVLLNNWRVHFCISPKMLISSGQQWVSCSHGQCRTPGTQVPPLYPRLSSGIVETGKGQIRTYRDTHPQPTLRWNCQLRSSREPQDWRFASTGNRDTWIEYALSIWISTCLWGVTVARFCSKLNSEMILSVWRNTKTKCSLPGVLIRCRSAHRKKAKLLLLLGADINLQQSLASWPRHLKPRHLHRVWATLFPSQTQLWVDNEMISALMTQPLWELLPPLQEKYFLQSLCCLPRIGCHQIACYPFTSANDALVAA